MHSRLPRASDPWPTARKEACLPFSLQALAKAIELGRVGDLPSNGLAHAPTLVIAPHVCLQHRTCPEPTARGIDRPPENPDRLKVLTDPGEFSRSMDAAAVLDRRGAMKCRWHPGSYCQEQSSFEQLHRTASAPVQALLPSCPSSRQPRMPSCRLCLPALEQLHRLGQGSPWYPLTCCMPSSATVLLPCMQTAASCGPATLPAWPGSMRPRRRRPRTCCACTSGPMYDT